MFASPSYSRKSDEDEDDYASFCFCGEEVEPDSDGEVSIYCSTKCARQDALQALSSASCSSAPLTGPSSHVHSPAVTSSILPDPSLPFAKLPISESQSTLRQADVPSPSSFEHFHATVSHSLGLPPRLSQQDSPLGPAAPILRKRTPSEEEAFQNGIATVGGTGAYEDGPEEDGVLWQASHYRRMHRERQQMLEDRRKRREARKQAAAAAASLNSLRSSQQQRVGLPHHHRQQPSTSSISSSTDYSLSRSNTASSTTSSSSRFVSTHPSRARTPDLLSSSRHGHHGRNESLGSSISSLSSSSFSHGHHPSQSAAAGASNTFWGFAAPPRVAAAEGSAHPGWGSGAVDLAIREEGEELYDGMDEDEGEEDAGNKMDLIPNRFGGGGSTREKQPKQPQLSAGQGKSASNMRMSDLLDSIMDMESNFFSSPSASPAKNAQTSPPPSTSSHPQPFSWTATPPKKAFARSSKNLTPKASLPSFSNSDDPFNPQTPQLQKSSSSGASTKHNKRSAPSPPSPLRASVQHNEGTTSFRMMSHRQSKSWSTGLKKQQQGQGRMMMWKGSMDAEGGGAGSRGRSSGEEAAAVLRGEGIKRSGSPLPPPPSSQSRPRTLVYSPASASAPEGLASIATPAPSSFDPPRPFQQHSHQPIGSPHTRNISAGSTASSNYLPILPPFSTTSTSSRPLPATTSSSSIFSNRYPLNLDSPSDDPDSLLLPLAPPLFPSTPGQHGTPEFERLMGESGRERFCSVEEGMRMDLGEGAGGGEEEEEERMSLGLGVSTMTTLQASSSPPPPSSIPLPSAANTTTPASTSWFRRRF